MRYRNTGGRRVWPTLIDELTGRTLELDSGQECELSGEVNDPYLEPVGASEPAVQVDLHTEPVAPSEDELRAQILADEAALAAAQGEQPSTQTEKE